MYGHARFIRRHAVSVTVSTTMKRGTKKKKKKDVARKMTRMTMTGAGWPPRPTRWLQLR
jgi:phenylpyruvate tautomerase PptA (4-oxalocrotonate tautomerase family)